MSILTGLTSPFEAFCLYDRTSLARKIVKIRLFLSCPQNFGEELRRVNAPLLLLISNNRKFGFKQPILLASPTYSVHSAYVDRNENTSIRFSIKSARTMVTGCRSSSFELLTR